MRHSFYYNLKLMAISRQEGVSVLAQSGKDPAHPVLVVFVAVVSRLCGEYSPALHHSPETTDHREI